MARSSRVENAGRGPTVIRGTVNIFADVGLPDAASIRVTGKSVVPVAVLSDTFDASFVDPLSVKFGPGQAPPLSFALVDADGDGDQDLVLVFNTAAAGLTCGQTRATLTGQTRGGGRIEGTDRFTPTPCR
jgi:hypothetical protein